MDGVRTNYDLPIVPGGRRVFLRIADSGVALEDDVILWMAAGKEEGAGLHNIASVHLQSGAGGTLNQCTIRFRDGYTLVVMGGNAGGFKTDEHTARYAAFVRDLHDRIAALPQGTTATFTAGLPAVRRGVVMVCVFLLGLICVVGPVVGFVLTGEIKLLGALFVGAGLVWPMARMVKENAPRAYNPSRPPEELLD